MTFGYILVVVAILANGDIEGQAIDWYADPHECYARVEWEEDKADLGLGFTCVEDVVKE